MNTACVASRNPTLCIKCLHEAGDLTEKKVLMMVVGLKDDVSDYRAVLADLLDPWGIEIIEL